MSNIIYTPDDPDFYDVLHGTLPPNWQQHGWTDAETCLGVDAETGILKPLNRNEFLDYAFGGEYDVWLEKQDVNSSEELDSDWSI